MQMLTNIVLFTIGPSAYRSPVVAISFVTMTTRPSLSTLAEPATNHMIEQIASQWQSDGPHVSLIGF